MKKQSIILGGLLLLALVLAGCTLGGQGGGPTGITPTDLNTHLVCKDLRCVRVQGPGQNQCKTNSDCNVSHLECRNLQCIRISGGGQNLCQSNADCNASHLECRNLRCISIQGQGQNLCTSDANCQDQNHHLACVNQSCVSVPGQGQDLCQTNADCNASLGVDLVVNSMPHSFYPDYNAATYALDFNVLIQNIGNQTYTGSVSLFGIKRWDTNSGGHGSIPYSTNCYANLPPMAIKSCYFSHSTNNPAGNYNLYAYVDSNHLISELNENNNDKNVTFHIP